MTTTRQSQSPESAGSAHGRRSFLMRHAALWLVPVSVVFALLVLEGVLRAFPTLLPAEAQLNQLWQSLTRPQSIGDPYLGFVYPPHYRMTVTSRDYRFTIESDEHGFRNASPWPDRAEIVIVGDSMAYGYGLEEDVAWTRLVDEALPGSRVVSLALPGTTPQQYARYFERFGSVLNPKITIFTIFPGNDLSEATTFDRWLAAGSPGNYGVWRHLRPASGVQAVLDRSLLFLTLRSLRRSVQFGLQSQTIDLADGGTIQVAPSVYRDEMTRNEPSDVGFQMVVKAAMEARDQARSVGSQFVVLLVPLKESIYLPLRGVAFPGLIHPLKDVLETEGGIACIDLTEPFRAWAGKGHQLYFTTDGHPNALGNRVTADVVTQYLRANAQALGLDD